MAYSVDSPLPAAEWLALSEDERAALIDAAHRATGSPMGTNAGAHATIHALVETHLAEGTPAAVRAYDRLRAAGLNRHVTVHALASVVTRHMLASLENDAPDEETAARDFDALDPASFRKR